MFTKIQNWLSINSFLISSIVFFLALPAQAQDDEFTIEPASHIGGNTTCSAVQGNYAFVGQGGFLSVVDISGAIFRQVA
ncbi:MAG: hypothetical protein ACE5HS_17400 [bacterium]